MRDESGNDPNYAALGIARAQRLGGAADRALLGRCFGALGAGAAEARARREAKAAKVRREKEKKAAAKREREAQDAEAAATAAAVDAERRRVEAAAEAAAKAAAAVAAATHARSIVDRDRPSSRASISTCSTCATAASGAPTVVGDAPRPAARTLPPCQPSPSASSSSDRSGGSSGRCRSSRAPLDSLVAGAPLSGVVVGVKDFGVFVACGAERDGLIHVSEFPRGVPPPELGRRIDCYVQRVDLRQGRLSLTLYPPPPPPPKRAPPPPPPPPPPPRARSPPPAPPPSLTRSFALADFALVATHDRRAAAPRAAVPRAAPKPAPAPAPAPVPMPTPTPVRAAAATTTTLAESIEWVAPVTEEELAATRDVLATRTFRRGAARDAPARTMVLTDLEWRTAPQPLLVLLPHDPNW